MIKIIGNKDEVGSLLDAINDTNSYFTTYEYMEQEKDTFHVQYRYDEKDLDYELYVEWFDNKNSTKELTTAIDNFRNNCIKKWNKLKDENKWIEGENEYERL